MFFEANLLRRWYRSSATVNRDRRAKGRRIDMNNKVHSFVINGFPIEVADMPKSISPLIIYGELQADCYGLNRIDFKPGDVIIDIGAHIGMFAIYTALRFPQVVIHAFEPFPENFERLKQNLDRNGITTVRIHHQGATGDGRLLEMVTSPQNSGGSTCHSRTLEYGRITGIPSTTLDHIFDSLGVDKCNAKVPSSYRRKIVLDKSRNADNLRRGE